MTYTYKLAHRLAMFRSSTVLGLLVLATACGSDNLSPTGGSDTPAEAPTTGAVVLMPRNVTAETDQPIKFAGFARSAAGDSLTSALRYTVTGGTISRDGIFSASTEGTYRVIAKGDSNTKPDTGTVTILTARKGLSAIVVAPDTAKVATGGKQSFTATGKFKDGSTTAVGVNWTATGGTIDAGGTYTAGSVVGTYKVIATSASNSTLADTATVIVTTATTSPVLQAVVVTPSTVSLQAGGTQQFVANGRMSDGTSSAVTVKWTATGGTISSGGLYTAGSIAGTFRVSASTTSGLANSAGVTVSAASSGSRNPLTWPFASTSIWNMPIGSGAVYVAANLNPVPGGNQWANMPGVDGENIVLKPTAPLTNIMYSSAGWTQANRCAATGGLLFQAPVPTNYVVPNGNGNNSAALLLADRRTILQSQPFTRCTSGSDATSIASWAAVDLYGAGIPGSHGGSGLSALGGSIRLGELRPGGQGPRHALKIEVYAYEALYRCTTSSACYRWPATTADGYAVGRYGVENSNSNTAMKMGALLAIPASVTLASLNLETDPGRQLAWTLENYGAYIVDDTWGPAVAIAVENGPDGSFAAQFQADYGYPLRQYVNSNSPWSRDVQKLVQALRVVNNNGPNSIGGGGTPLQALAPPLQ
jgi:hypothetical protein